MHDGRDTGRLQPPTLSGMQVCAPSLGWEGLSELKAMGNVTLVSPTVDVASLIRSAKVCPPAHVLCSRVGLLLVTRPRASVAVVVCERFDCARIGAAALHALQVLLAPSIWWEAFGMVAERGMPALPSLLVCYGSFHG